MNIDILKRKKTPFFEDLIGHQENITKIINKSSFLILGGAGSIGQSIVKILFANNPQKIHVIDISENNIVELVRDLRSSYGYIDGEFKVLSLDISSEEFDKYFEKNHNFDYVFNLTALKHVRSEDEVFTLMRLVNTNILNTKKNIELCIKYKIKNYFSVSSDKAASPVNLMGASKKVMEDLIFTYSDKIKVNTARFANVAFSDGSLLYSFVKRIEKKQPISSPIDIKRYFINHEDAGQICIFSSLIGNKNEIFFPKLSNSFDEIFFHDLALSFLKKNNLEPIICKTEQEARDMISKINLSKLWPCYFFKTDTSGEKYSEKFYHEGEIINLNKYNNFGIVKPYFNKTKIKSFISDLNKIKKKSTWKKEDFIKLFKNYLGKFSHSNKTKSLNQKM